MIATITAWRNGKEILVTNNTIKWELIALLNKWLRQFGLALTTAQHLQDLEHQACELAALSAPLYTQHESEEH